MIRIDVLDKHKKSNDHHPECHLSDMSIMPIKK